MQHHIYDPINHPVFWPSQLWCVDDGDADELVVTTTMASAANIHPAWRSRVDKLVDETA
jgi:hypothetical protein